VAKITPIINHGILLKKAVITKKCTSIEIHTESMANLNNLSGARAGGILIPVIAFVTKYSNQRKMKKPMTPVSAAISK
jgi:hypothetical protein